MVTERVPAGRKKNDDEQVIDTEIQHLASNDDTQVIFSIDGVQNLLPGARYVSVLRGANSVGTAELREIRITYAPPS